MNAQVYSVPGQTEGRMKAYLEWQAYIYPLDYLFHVGVMSTIIKVLIILFLLCLWE